MPDTKWVSKQNLQTFWEFIKDNIGEAIREIAPEVLSDFVDNLADREDGETATQNYNAGKYLLVDGQFHKTTTSITSGETFEEGVNITQTNIGNELSGIIDTIYPVGSLYMSLNSTMPAILTAGRTWELLPANYILKTINTGTGGTPHEATKTGGNNDSSESIKLTPAQSGMPEHNFDAMKGRYAYIGQGSYVATWFGDAGSGVSLSVTKGITAAQGHSHKLNNHQHTPGMPANIDVYVWKRTA